LGETALRIFNCQLDDARQKQKQVNKEQNTAGAIKKLSKISASADVCVSFLAGGKERKHIEPTAMSTGQQKLEKKPQHFLPKKLPPTLNW